MSDVDDAVALKLIEVLDIAQLNATTLDTLLTPLHFASRENKLQIAQALIQKGVNQNIKNFEGKTPLDLATTEEMRNLLSSS